MAEMEKTEEKKDKPDNDVQNTVMKALLLPAAEKLGGALADKVQRILDEKQAKREEQERKNIALHINAVMNRRVCPAPTGALLTKEDLEAQISQVALLPDWIEGAKKIDPENDENKVVAGLWQDVLQGLINGYQCDESLVGTLAKLREGEAKLLLSFGGTGEKFFGDYYIEKARVDSLALFGLIEKPRLLNIFKYEHFRKKIGINAALICSSAVLLFLGIAISEQRFDYEGAFAIFVLAVILVVFDILVKIRFFRVLTKKGRQLLSLAPEFEDK